MRAFFYAWSLAARFYLRVNAARPRPAPHAKTYRGPRSVARGPRSGDHCHRTRTRHRIATRRRSEAMIRDPPAGDIETWHFVRKLGHRAGNSEPLMLHPGGRRADTKTWEFTRKTPLGSLPISGQNPRKLAKNAATSGRAQGPWGRRQGPCFSQIFM